MHLDITESSREAVNQEWSQGCRHNHWLNLNTGIVSSMELLWCNILNGISLTFYNCQTTKVMRIFQEYFHLSQVEHFVRHSRWYRGEYSGVCTKSFVTRAASQQLHCSAGESVCCCLFCCACTSQLNKGKTITPRKLKPIFLMIQSSRQNLEHHFAIHQSKPPKSGQKHFVILR